MSPLSLLGITAGQTVLAYFRQPHSLDSLPTRGKGDRAALFFPANRGTVYLLQGSEQFLPGLFGDVLKAVVGSGRLFNDECIQHLRFCCLQRIPDMTGGGQKQLAFLTQEHADVVTTCLLYTSDAADDLTRVDLGC